jgi:hypothetical protein
MEESVKDAQEEANGAGDNRGEHGGEKQMPFHVLRVSELAVQRNDGLREGNVDQVHGGQAAAQMLANFAPASALAPVIMCGMDGSLWI